ncbi:hypothetical protein LTR12_002000 [Friedmanniomyces endolithicus]|nr:hypothetical protein LTR74_011116 [Friedmanniomyces endolithicus]KAK1823589.1 hypothetical protein LTR12_002000 [Friedmanniomyces endolithicus]
MLILQSGIESSETVRERETKIPGPPDDGGVGVAALGLVDDQGLPLPLDLPFRPVRHLTSTTTAVAGQADPTIPLRPVLEPVYQLPVPDENFCMLDADQTLQGLNKPTAEGFPLDPSLLPPTPPPEWEDVLGTDFSEGFDLNQELWQYS